MSMIEFLKREFWHVAPILASGFIALAIIAERARALFWVYGLSNKDEFFGRLRSYILANRMQDAVALCNNYRESPIAYVAKEAIQRAHLPEEIISDGLAMAVGECQQAIQKRTGFLSTIANVATLLGLFGTIAGLIASFQAVGSANAQEKAALLAAGISTAMNATMLGLGVAIPCMVAFSFLINKSNRLCAEIEHSAIRTLDLLRQRYYAGASQQAQAAAAERKLHRGLA